MSNKDVIDDLKKQGLDEYGSWAVYGKNAMDAASNHGTIHAKDMSFPELSEDELVKKIKTQYILVGACISDRGIIDDSDWSNFHDKRGTSKDGNILKIISESKYGGSYMTDIIKFPYDAKDENKNSNNISTRMQNVCENKGNADDCKTFEFSMERFQKELDIIKPKEIIVFGNDAFNIFQMAVKKKRLHVSNKLSVVKTLHYSKQNQSNVSMYNRFSGNPDDIVNGDEHIKYTINAIINPKQ